MHAQRMVHSVSFVILSTVIFAIPVPFACAAAPSTVFSLFAAAPSPLRTARFALTPRLAVIGSTAPVRRNVTIGGLFRHHVTGTVRDATRSGFFAVLARAPAGPLAGLAARDDFAAVFVFQLVVFVGTCFSPCFAVLVMVYLRSFCGCELHSHTFSPPVVFTPRTSAIDRARRHGTRGPSRELIAFVCVDSRSFELLNGHLFVRISVSYDSFVKRRIPCRCFATRAQGMSISEAAVWDISRDKRQNA